MGGAANEIDKCGHTDQTAADSEDTCEPASCKADEDGKPCGAVNACCIKMNHGGNLDLVKGLMPFDTGFKLVDLFSGLDGGLFFFSFDIDVMEHHPGDKGQENEI